MHLSSEDQFGRETRREPGAAAKELGTAANLADRRRHSRHAVQGEAEVIVAGGVQLFLGRVLDISLSGCFIETSARLNASVGTRAALVFRANGAMLRTPAIFRVIRAGKGAGFLFGRLDGRTREGLQRLIAALERTG
jgi:hypothetical protein